MEIEETLSEIERFFERASQVVGVEAWPRELPPASDADIDALARKFELTIPDDVRRFWRHGLKYQELSIGDQKDFASAGFEWRELRYIDRDIPMHREEIAPLYDAGSDERRLLEKGIPLSYGQPEIVWDPKGGIVHFSTHNDLQPPVTRSFGEFLEHWLESGCFESHAITRWLPTIQHLVPGRIAAEKNLWIAYYKKVFAAYA